MTTLFIAFQFGDPKVAFRDRIREIFRKLGFVFPPSKLLSHYVENGLPSKNARVRTECLGELGFLFSKNGLQVCTPSKTLPVVAKHIGDRDAAVRTAALLTLGEAYKIVGDDIYKLVGTLSGKDRSLLEERLKRTAAPAPKSLSQRVNPTSPPHRARTSAIATSPPAGEGTPRGTKMAIPSRLARPQSTVGSGIPAAGGRSRLPALGGRRESAIPPAVRRSLGMPEDRNGSSSPSPPESPSRQHASLRSSSNGGGPPSSLSQHQGEGYEQYSDGAEDAEEEDFAVEQAINEILSSDSDRSVDALKRVEREIHEVAPSLVHHADQLAIVLGKQIHRAFTFEGTNMGNERLKKHLMVTGTSVFDVNRVWEDGCTLGSYMSRPALIPLLTELLQRLIDASAQTDDPSAQTYSKYLNIIVLRSFSACNLNNLFA